MKKLIAIAFFAVSTAASAQSYSPEADSVIISKDSITAKIAMAQLSSIASQDFFIGTQYAERIPFSPMYHWETYVKGTYNNADSITAFNRDNISHYSRKPVKIRTFRFWKDGQVKRWITYVFIDDQLTQITDSNLGDYYTSVEEAEKQIFKAFTAKREL